MTVCFSICDGKVTILKAATLIPGLAIDSSCCFIISLLELPILSFVLVKYKHTAFPDPGLERTSTDGEHESCNLQRIGASADLVALEFQCLAATFLSHKMCWESLQAMCLSETNS